MKVKLNFRKFPKKIFTCLDTSSVEDFMRSRPHTIDSRQIDPKRASKNISFQLIESI
jgi:hypothetical protein